MHNNTLNLWLKMNFFFCHFLPFFLPFFIIKYVYTNIERVRETDIANQKKQKTFYLFRNINTGGEKTSIDNIYFSEKNIYTRKQMLH